MPSSVSKKIRSVISVNDIPKTGENIGCTLMFGSERLFADKCVEYAGEPLGFVVSFQFFYYLLRIMCSSSCLTSFSSLCLVRLLKHRSMLIWPQNKL